MSKPIDDMSNANIHAVLDYLAEEIESAENKDDLLSVLSLTRELFLTPPMQNAVYGLENIRAEVDSKAIARDQSMLQCTVQLEVPHILSTTFQDLSKRMRELQSDDPETFANATSALTWLARGQISTN